MHHITYSVVASQNKGSYVVCGNKLVYDSKFKLANWNRAILTGKSMKLADTILGDET